MTQILVTGASGFIGKSLIGRLCSSGYDVIGIDINEGDITVENTLIPYIGKNISHVIHLAGKTFVPESWKEPFDFYRVNIMGTVNVLEFCRRTGASLTFISSYIYGQPDYLPIDEKHPVKSYNPYSNSKLLAEEACRFYGKAFGQKVVILRPFNVFGPDQPTRFLIPEIISMVLDPAILRIEVMDLRPKRDYVFIDDLVAAFIKSINKPSAIYNIGSGISFSPEEIIQLVMKLTGIKKPYNSRGLSRQNEIFELYADSNKAMKELNWKPEISFEAGIEACIKFYSKNKF